MNIDNYIPERKEIDEVIKKIKLRDKKDLKIALIKSRLKLHMSIKMEGAIYYLLAYLSNKCKIDFNSKITNDKTYMQFILDKLKSYEGGGVDNDEKITEFIGGLNEELQKQRPMPKASTNPRLTKLEEFLKEFISKKPQESKKPSRKARSKSVATASRASVTAETADKRKKDLVKARSNSVIPDRGNLVGKAFALGERAISTVLGSGKKATSQSGKTGQEGSSHSESRQRFAPFSQRFKNRSNSAPPALKPASVPKPESASKASDPEGKPTSAAGTAVKTSDPEGKPTSAAGTAVPTNAQTNVAVGTKSSGLDKKRKELRGLIEKNKKKLSDFYDRYKGKKFPYDGENFPDFEEKFGDLKASLIGGVKGAKKLLFDIFLARMLPNLEEEEIEKVYKLITEASEYVDKKQTSPLSHEKQKRLREFIGEKRKSLSEFYEKYKDNETLKFSNNFFELRDVLNGGKIGAKTLNFDKFLSEVLPKLNLKETVRVYKLVEEAFNYTEKMETEIEKIKSDPDKVDKIATKVGKWFTVLVDGVNLNDNYLKDFCVNYLDECRMYVSEGKDSEFAKKFIYPNLENKRLSDFKDYYRESSIRDDVEQHLNDYYNHESVTIKLKQELIKNYKEATETKKFEKHEKWFEEYREETIKFLNKMRNFAIANCDQQWIDGGRKPEDIIHDYNKNELIGMFNKQIENIELIKGNWEKLDSEELGDRDIKQYISEFEKHLFNRNQNADGSATRGRSVSLTGAQASKNAEEGRKRSKSISFGKFADRKAEKNRRERFDNSKKALIDMLNNQKIMYNIMNCIRVINGEKELNDEESKCVFDSATGRIKPGKLRGNERLALSKGTLRLKNMKETIDLTLWATGSGEHCTLDEDMLMKKAEKCGPMEAQAGIRKINAVVDRYNLLFGDANIDDILRKRLIDYAKSDSFFEIVKVIDGEKELSEEDRVGMRAGLEASSGERITEGRLMGIKLGLDVKNWAVQNTASEVVLHQEDLIAKAEDCTAKREIEKGLTIFENIEKRYLKLVKISKEQAIIRNYFAARVESPDFDESLKVIRIINGEDKLSKEQLQSVEGELKSPEKINNGKLENIKEARDLRKWVTSREPTGRGKSYKEHPGSEEFCKLDRNVIMDKIKQSNRPEIDEGEKLLEKVKNRYESLMELVKDKPVKKKRLIDYIKSDLFGNIVKFNEDYKDNEKAKALRQFAYGNEKFCKLEKEDFLKKAKTCTFADTEYCWKMFNDAMDEYRELLTKKSSEKTQTAAKVSKIEGLYTYLNSFAGQFNEIKTELTKCANDFKGQVLDTAQGDFDKQFGSVLSDASKNFLGTFFAKNSDEILRKCNAISTGQGDSGIEEDIARLYQDIEKKDIIGGKIKSIEDFEKGIKGEISQMYDFVKINMKPGPIAIKLPTDLVVGQKTKNISKALEGCKNTLAEIKDNWKD